MPFDASLSIDLTVQAPAHPVRRDRRPALSLGVFHHDGAWKIYSEFERAAAYPCREQAVTEAQARAAEAARCGRRVALFIEDESGELRQAAIELH